MIKAVIVDDESCFREMVSTLLGDYFPDVEVVAFAEGVDDAVAAVEQYRPALLFLDIEIKGGTGFHVLQRLKYKDFKLIFITAFNEFAIQAIKFSAIDYILKPINEFEFKAGVEKALSGIGNDTPLQSENLLFNYADVNHKKLVLRTAQEIHVVKLADLVRCEADNAYTTFILVSGEKIVVSKGLGEYAEMLSGYGFVRPHQSHLVNIDYIRKFDKSEGGRLVLKDRTSVPVSTRHKNRLLETLGKL